MVVTMNGVLAAASVSIGVTEWRMVLGAGLVLLGAGLVVAGALAVPRGGDRQRSWLAWALTYLYVFRRVVVGACIVAAGVGLAEDVPWLLAASVCIGLGEWLESSYYVAVIRWGTTFGG
jgi:hypothetical protein